MDFLRRRDVFSFFGKQNRRFYTAYELENIDKAFLFAFIVHFSQKRKNGQPYIVHPLTMAHISMNEFRIYDLHVVMDIAIHDTREQKGATLLGIGLRMFFDSETMKDNHLLTKTDKNKAVYLKKIVSSKNWRVLYVKLIDRLHNMRTLVGTSKEFQSKQTKETVEHFLSLCTELEKIIPDEYKEVPKKIHDKLIALCAQYGY